MSSAPDPYARSIFHGKPLDNATIARLKQAEEKLGYELTITQGIGGASASAGTHVIGRAVDLAPYDQERKVRVLRDLGFAAWFRPYIYGLWPAHIHAVLVFDGRDNRRGIADSAWRQIGSYDRGRDGLKYDRVDPNPYRPDSPRGFSMEDYRRTFAAPKPEREVARLDTVVFNPWVGNKDFKRNMRQLIEDTGRPVGLMLSEMKGHDWTPRGYTRIEPPKVRFPHPDARSNVLLVRNRGVKIHNRGYLDIARFDDTGWRWGPKGQPKNKQHPPKVYPWAKVEHQGQMWGLLAGHRVVSGFKLNTEEWAAEDQAIVRWFNLRDHIPCLAGMDWNDRLGGREPLGVASLAKRVDGKPAIIDIDGAIVTDVDRVKVEKLDHRYGSDAHHPVHVFVKKVL